MWRQLAENGVHGRYDNNKVALGVIQAIMATEDRRSKRKKTTNIPYTAEAMEFFTNLVLISPKAYSLFRTELAAPHLRTIKYVICAMLPAILLMRS
jgi:hypothetical protein